MELDNVHSAYNQLLFQSNMNDTDIDKELETDDLHKTQYLTAKMKMMAITSSTPEKNVASRMFSANAARTSKLSKLKLPKFSGNVKD